MLEPANVHIKEPVSPDEFARWLHIGIGRPILYLQHHDPAPYREMILDACLHNRVYDPQSEGTREEYLVEVAEAAGTLDAVRDAVLAELAGDFGREAQYNDREQWASLLGVLAERGDADALATLWAGFEADPLDVRVFGRQIVERGDLDALLQVTDRIGKALLLADLEEYGFADEYVVAAEERHGRDAVWGSVEHGD